MQLRHTVGLRPPEAHYHHAIAIQLAGFERRHDVVLAVEHHRRRFDNLVVGGHRRGFHHRTAQIACHHFGAAVMLKRLSDAGDHAGVERAGHAFAPRQLAIIQPWFPV